MQETSTSGPPVNRVTAGPHMCPMWKEKGTRINSILPESGAHDGENGSSGWTVVNRATAGEGARVR